MLLSLARGIFEEQQNLDKLVERIMLEAQDMLKCERCSVYLVEDVLEGVRYDIRLYLYCGSSYVDHFWKQIVVNIERWRVDRSFASR